MASKPFVDAKTKMAEFSVVPLIAGVILGIVFGASSLYLALKVGLTVSASIPIAVLSVTLFRAFSKAFGVRNTTILENNLVQTTGSAGESIAFGVAVTMPALLLMGYEMELSRVMMVAVLGALLGVLMMIPLRRALIVKEHDTLSFPEGTACAEVLVAGEKGGASAVTVFLGFFFGLAYKFFNVGTKLWKDTPEHNLGWYKGAALSAEVSPELMGVGYIIGPRISSIMVAGGVLSSLVIIPMIVLFGSGLTAPLYPATKLISQMALHEIWKNYVLYIGAGAVAAGGIISLFQSLPVIIKGALGGISSLRGTSTADADPNAGTRIDRDLPMWVVGLGCVILVSALTFWPSLHLNIFGALLILLFGFLFVTVSSRLTGTIGSSSNPISGMTVATLLLTCLIFVVVGWIGADYRVMALSIAAIVCVAASNGGTTAQDLKTGYLVGATPWAQQVGLLVGAITSALVIGFTLNLLNEASTVYSKKDLPQNVVDISSLSEKGIMPGMGQTTDTGKEYFVLRVKETETAGAYAGIPKGKYFVDAQGKIQYLVDPGINGALKTRDDGTPVPKYDAPKASLMALIIDGILTQKLPWGLVLLGVFIAVVLELCGISSLPFAVGVYLPLSASTPIFAGGMVRWFVDRWNKPKSLEETETSPGVLLSSGLIAGGSIAGILLALLAVAEGWGRALDLSAIVPGFANSDGVALMMFIGMGLFVFLIGTGKLLKN